MTKAMCSVEGCEQPVFARELCVTHYDRARYVPRVPLGTTKQCVDCGERYQKGARQRCSTCYGRWYYANMRVFNRQCRAKGCSEPHHARGWCTKHYQRWKKTQVAEHGAVPLVVTTCANVACDRTDHTANGYCNACYQRLRKYGRLEKLPQPDAATAFWAKVNKTDHCWLWTGVANYMGYGNFRHRTEGSWQAHRWSYTKAYGPIPDGLVIDHFVCDNPPCVRPDHLRACTIAENTIRSLKPPTHCPNGHPYDEANTYVLPKGGRRCRTCRTATWRRRKAQAIQRRHAVAAALNDSSSGDERGEYTP